MRMQKEVSKRRSYDKKGGVKTVEVYHIIKWVVSM